MASILLLLRRVLSRLTLSIYALASQRHTVSFLVNVYERIRMRQIANKCFEPVVVNTAAVHSQALENERCSLGEAPVEVYCKWADCMQAVHRAFAVDWLCLAAVGAA